MSPKTLASKAASPKVAAPEANSFFFAKPTIKRKTPEDLSVIKLGLFPLLLRFGWESQLYPILNQDLAQVSNRLMDFAGFALSSWEQRLGESGPRAKFLSAADLSVQAALKAQLRFAPKAITDRQLSSFMEREVAGSALHQFKRSWLAHCAQTGVKKAWLYLVSSTIEDENPWWLEVNYSKKQRNSDCAALWAVSADDGLPLTWAGNVGTVLAPGKLE